MTADAYRHNRVYPKNPRIGTMAESIDGFQPPTPALARRCRGQHAPEAARPPSP